MAHYWTYLVFAGQDTPAVLVDPLERGTGTHGDGASTRSRRRSSRAGSSGGSQIALIVVGHVAAIVAAHRVALGYHRRESRGRRACSGQFPVVLLMVGYTIAGLWVLAQQLAA